MLTLEVLWFRLRIYASMARLIVLKLAMRVVRRAIDWLEPQR